MFWRDSSKRQEWHGRWENWRGEAPRCFWVGRKAAQRASRVVDERVEVERLRWRLCEGDWRGMRYLFLTRSFGCCADGS